MIAPGEATIAVVGLTPVLKRDMPYVGVEKGREIAGLQKRISGLARDLVNDEIPRKLKMPMPWSYPALLDRFTTPLDDSDLEYITGQFASETHDIVSDFLVSLQATFAHLSSEVPVEEYQTYNGPKKIKPSSDRIWRWYSRYWVLSDPLVTFPLMQTGALLPEQANALEEYYPGLYEAFESEVRAAIVYRGVHDSSFLNLSPTTDRGVGILLKRKLVPYGSNVKVTKPEPKAPPLPLAQRKPDPALQTAGQKAEAM